MQLFACKALLNEAQSKLVNVTHDQKQYKSILESLVEQVVTVWCLHEISIYHISVINYHTVVSFCHMSV